MHVHQATWHKHSCTVGAAQAAQPHAALPEACDLTELPEQQHSTAAPSREQKASRRTYAAKIAYFGPAFPDGWAWASHLEGTTQEAVQQALAQALNLRPDQQVSAVPPLKTVLL